jgi:hypothetical protein
VADREEKLRVNVQDRIVFVTKQRTLTGNSLSLWEMRTETYSLAKEKGRDRTGRTVVVLLALGGGRTGENGLRQRIACN